MIKKIFISTLVFLAITSCIVAQFEGSKQVFKSPKLEDAIKTHKTVAILPFTSTITYKKQPKDFSIEANTADEKKLALELQQGMFTYLLNKADKFIVSFQDIERTNALLKSSGAMTKLDELTLDSVCKILKVDAVIKSKYAYQRTGSEGGAIAKTILLGPGWGKVASGGLTMQIYNGLDGELLWRFYKEMEEDVIGSANAVMERMMRKVARNFPYEK